MSGSWRIILFSVLFLPRFACGEPLSISNTDVYVEQRFDSFAGTHATLPSSFGVSKDTITLMDAKDDDFRGTSAGGVTAGGCYAWQIASNDCALGYQPTADEFTPGFFSHDIINVAPRAVRSIQVEYDIVYMNNADRSSSLALEIGLDGSNFLRCASSCFVTPAARNANTSERWKRAHISVSHAFDRAVRFGGVISLRWAGDDAGGTGSRDEHGIDNVKIRLRPSPGTLMVFR